MRFAQNDNNSNSHLSISLSQPFLQLSRRELNEINELWLQDLTALASFLTGSARNQQASRMDIPGRKLKKHLSLASFYAIFSV